MQFSSMLDSLSLSGRSFESTDAVTIGRVVRDPAPTAVPVPCQEHDAELWFAESTAMVERAKALCASCPFVAQCLTGALERAEPWGVWGGQVFVDGVVVATKRGRGRPRKNATPVAA